MNDMTITSAQYVNDVIRGTVNGIQATIDGKVLRVPLAAGNTDYDEIMRQVEAGTLTIQDAE
jgi:hypothetical protein